MTREPDEGKEEALVELKDGNPGGEVKKRSMTLTGAWGILIEDGSKEH